MGSAPDSMTVADLAQVTFTAMDQADAAEIAAWRYPGIYAFYDAPADPGDLAELLNPRLRDGAYFSARVMDVGLIGFVELKPQPGGALELGLGLAPRCTGRGLGTGFVRRVCAWALARVAPSLLILQVAAFNLRAIRVYERVGFHVVDRELADSFGVEVEFVRMERANVSPG